MEPASSRQQRPDGPPDSIEHLRLQRAHNDRNLHLVVVGWCTRKFTRDNPTTGGWSPIRAAPKPPIGSDLTDWARSIRALASFDHIACKLSGLVTEADWTTWTPADLTPVTDVVLECFGPNRTMFGSDWPVCLLAVTYREVVDVADSMTAGLSADERSQLFAGTARKWYSLT